MSIVFGTVHSNRTVVVLLYKHFSSWLTTFCSSVNIITNCTYTTVRASDIMANVNNSFTFLKSAISPNFSSIRTVFHQYFTWIALDDVDLQFSLILATKANIAEGGTTGKEWSFLLYAKLHYTENYCTLFVLNWKLSCKFEKLCKFSRCVKAKLDK